MNDEHAIENYRSCQAERETKGVTSVAGSALLTNKLEASVLLPQDALYPAIRVNDVSITFISGKNQ